LKHLFYLLTLRAYSFVMLLFLNDVSGTEVLVILIFILMFFGSKSIPGIARSMGRTIRQIKEASNDLQDEIRKSGVDIKKDLNLSNIIQETKRDIQQPLDQYVDDLDQSIKFDPPKNSQIPATPSQPIEEEPLKMEKASDPDANTAPPEEPVKEEEKK
jgi:sec-independent protein translocase protein TatA